jgi:hypothetical protein
MMKKILALLARSAFLAELSRLRIARAEALGMVSSPDPQMRAEGYLSLSYHYFQAATAGTCKLSRASFWRFWWQAPCWLVTWLPFNLWGYFRMLPLSDYGANLMTYEQMYASECLIRLGILLMRKEYEEAAVAAQQGLLKNPPEAHVRARFRLGLVEAHRHFARMEEAREELSLVLAEIRAIDGEDPREAVRIYRQAAKLIEKVPMPRNTISPENLRALASVRASQFA